MFDVVPIKAKIKISKNKMFGLGREEWVAYRFGLLGFFWMMLVPIRTRRLEETGYGSRAGSVSGESARFPGLSPPAGTPPLQSAAFVDLNTEKERTFLPSFLSFFSSVLPPAQVSRS